MVATVASIALERLEQDVGLFQFSNSPNTFIFSIFSIFRKSFPTKSSLKKSLEIRQPELADLPIHLQRETFDSLIV